jgi:hypothetical protein
MDKVSICNVALSHLANSTEIQDLDAEPSKEAQACRRLFDLTRDEVLRDFPWPFATASAALTLFASNPNTEWGYSYRMPAGKLFFRRILSGVGTTAGSPGSRIGFSPTTLASSFTPTCRTRRRVDQAGGEHRALATQTSSPRSRSSWLGVSVRASPAAISSSWPIARFAFTNSRATRPAPTPRTKSSSTKSRVQNSSELETEAVAASRIADERGTDEGTEMLALQETDQGLCAG